MKNSIINYYMDVAILTSKLSYCKRRQVGSIIVKNDKIISIGYNGTISGAENICEDIDGNTKDDVVHAEENSILKLAKSTESSEGSVMFVSTEPCIKCAKLIILSGISHVYYSDDYNNSGGIELLIKSGVKVTKHL